MSPFTAIPKPFILSGDKKTALQPFSSLVKSAVYAVELYFICACAVKMRLMQIVSGLSAALHEQRKTVNTVNVKAANFFKCRQSSLPLFVGGEQ